MTQAPRALWWAGAAVVLAGLLAPLLVAEVPPLADYPNHLARAYALAFGAGDPVLRPMFTATWALIPNLGLDLLLPPMMHLMPPYLAGRVLVGLAVLLPVTGVVALGRACFGRVSPWQLLAGFVAYNAMLLVGLLNFQLAAGLALWGASSWVLLAERPLLAAATGAAFGLACWVCHLFGFAFYALLIASAELVRRSRRDLPRRLAMLLAALAIPSVLTFTSAPGAGGPVTWQSAALKLLDLLVPVLAYSLTLARLTAAVLLAAVLVWAARRRLLLHPLGAVALPAILLLYVLAPFSAGDGALLDTRIPVLAALLLFATTLPVRLSRLEAAGAALVLGALFVARSAFITATWSAAQGDVRAVREVLADLPPGSRLLTVDASPDRHRIDLPRQRFLGPELPRSYWHLGALAYLDRHAFWSDAFTIPGQQPIVAGPRYAASASGGTTRPPDYTLLPPFADPARAPLPGFYLAGWPAKFDYVLLLNGEAVPDRAALLPARLQLLADRGFAALYAVKGSAVAEAR